MVRYSYHQETTTLLKMHPASKGDRKSLQKDGVRSQVKRLAKAIKESDLETVNLLLEAGTPPNKAAGNHGSSLLNLAVGLENVNIVRSLLKHRADPNWVLKPRVNAVNPVPEVLPLCTASKAARQDIMELLLDHGAELEKKDFRGETCLFHAVRSRKPSVVGALLDKGVQVDVRNCYGQSPLEIAQLWCPEMVRCLQNAHQARSSDSSSGSSQLSPLSVESHGSGSSSDRHPSEVSDSETSGDSYGKAEKTRLEQGNAEVSNEQNSDDEVFEDSIEIRGAGTDSDRHSSEVSDSETPEDDYGKAEMAQHQQNYVQVSDDQNSDYELSEESGGDAEVYHSFSESSDDEESESQNNDGELSED